MKLLSRRRDRREAGRPRRMRPARVGQWLALVLLAAIPLLTLGIGVAHAGEDSDMGKFSLYKMASTVSGFYSAQTSPDTAYEDRTNNFAQTGLNTTLANANSAGSVVGYVDTSFSLGNLVNGSWIESQLSGSSASISYDSLAAHDDQGTVTNANKGLQTYVYFGAANRDLGFDSMSSGIGGGIIHFVSGGIIWLFYAISIGVPWLFSAVIEILKVLNPFRLVQLAGLTGFAGSDSVLGGLATQVNAAYQFIVSMSWEVMVPIFFGVLILTMLLFKKGQHGQIGAQGRGSMIKLFTVRLLFLGLGLPLLGATYTGTLDKMSDAVSGADSGATAMVLSTYVDFDAWAMNKQLTIPTEANISWDPSAQHVMSASTMLARNSALAINIDSHGSTYRGQLHAINYSPAAEGAVAADPFALLASEHSDTQNPGDDNAVAATLGMITRYMTSADSSSSAYETQVKAQLQKYSKGDGDLQERVRHWFNLSDDDDYAKADKDNITMRVQDNPIVNSAPGTGLTNVGGVDGNGLQIFASPSAQDCQTQNIVRGGSNTPGPCNLSPLSMYNYLNTSFGPNSLVIYSSNKVTSGFTRENHAAVSSVGTGPARIMYWADCAVTLLAVILVGLSYAIGMLVGALKRSFNAISDVPFATLGSIQAIARVCAHVFALILEIVGTIFLYAFIAKILTILPTVAEGPLANALQKSSLLGSSTLGSVVVILMTFFIICFTIGFTVMAMRLRKSVLHAINEAASKFINKFLEPSSTPAPPPSGKLPGGGMPRSGGSGVGTSAGHAGSGALRSAAGSMTGGAGSRVLGNQIGSRSRSRYGAGSGVPKGSAGGTHASRGTGGNSANGLVGVGSTVTSAVGSAGSKVGELGGRTADGLVPTDGIAPSAGGGPNTEGGGVNVGDASGRTSDSGTARSTASDKELAATVLARGRLSRPGEDMVASGTPAGGGLGGSGSVKGSGQEQPNRAAGRRGGTLATGGPAGSTSPASPASPGGSASKKSAPESPAPGKPTRRDRVRAGVNGAAMGSRVGPQGAVVGAAVGVATAKSGKKSTSGQRPGNATTPAATPSRRTSGQNPTQGAQRTQNTQRTGSTGSTSTARGAKPQAQSASPVKNVPVRPRPAKVTPTVPNIVAPKAPPQSPAPRRTAPVRQQPTQPARPAQSALPAQPATRKSRRTRGQRD